MPTDPRDLAASLAAAAPFPLALIDAAGAIVAASRAFGEIEGLTPAALAAHEIECGGRRFEVWSCPFGDDHFVGLVDRTDVTRLEDQLWEMQAKLTQVYADLTVKNHELESRETQLKSANEGLEAKVRDQVQQIERSSRLMRYLSPEIAKAVVHGEAGAMATRKRVLTVFFADLSSFDDLISEMESEEIIEILNEYRKEMTEVLFAHGGTLDRFTTARLAAFFGDPVPHEDHAARAVRAGLAMRERVQTLRRKWFPSASQVDLQVGLNTGYVTVGNVGSEHRMDYTVVGKNVTVAAALQQEAKPGQILAAARTYEQVRALFDAAEVQVQMKGSSRPVQAYDVKGERIPDLPTIVAAPEQLPSKAPPKKLGPYSIVQKLGQGGMGVVYKALDERLQRHVALKVLASELAAEPRFVSRFKREARTLASLNSPHIAQIFYVSDAEVPPFFAMEFIDGPTLRKVIADQGKLPLRRALELASQMAQGLAAAAEKGVIHRDVKPDNVMLTAKGQAKLTDFGLGKSLGTDPGLTSRGFIVGTPLYMSPEQARGEEADLRSDMYSLGATLYHMLTGQPPFGGANTLAILRQHEEADLPGLSSLPSSISPDAYGVVRRMMAKRREDRYESYEALLAALESC